MTLYLVSLFLFAAAIRVLPAYLSSGENGVDQWAWRLIIDEMRKGSKIPVEIPQFLLDEKQWYPPLFQCLLAYLPAIIYKHCSYVVPIIFDLIRMGLLIFFVIFFSGSDVAGLISGFIYSVTPLLISYNMQLNPRGMAALFLDICMVGTFFFISNGFIFPSTEGSFLLFSFIILFSGLVLISHKMTTQLLWYLFLCVALITLNPFFLILIPLSIVMALIMSWGYYRFVFIAHYDVLKFWFKNWRWSGSHPILESPIYGEKNYESDTKFYKSGVYFWFRRLAFVIGFNPWAIISIGGFGVSMLNGLIPGKIIIFVFFWVLMVFLFGILTTIIPNLRCLGQGYLYGYNAAFPAAALMGLIFSNEWFWWTGLILGCLSSFIGIIAFFNKLLTSRTFGIDKDLAIAIKKISDYPNGVVMCLPQHWHNALAYQTKKPVLFGGHGYGFKLLEPIFPRLMLPIKSIIDTYKVSYLLTYKGYCGQKFIDDLPPHKIETFGDYQIYTFLNLGQKD